MKELTDWTVVALSDGIYVTKDFETGYKVSDPPDDTVDGDLFDDYREAMGETSP